MLEVCNFKVSNSRKLMAKTNKNINDLETIFCSIEPE